MSGKDVIRWGNPLARNGDFKGELARVMEKVEVTELPGREAVHLEESLDNLGNKALTDAYLKGENLNKLKKTGNS